MERKCCVGGQAQTLATRLIEATEREGETGKVLFSRPVTICSHMGNKNMNKAQHTVRSRQFLCKIVKDTNYYT